MILIFCIDDSLSIFALKLRTQPQNPSLYTRGFIVEKLKKQKGLLNNSSGKNKLSFTQKLFFTHSNEIYSEVGQGITRIFVTLACLFTLQTISIFYGLDSQEKSALHAVFGYFIFSAIYCFYVYKSKHPTIVRRYFVIIMDNLLISYCIYSFGIAGTAFYPLYLWVSIENGFRFGPTFLSLSSTISVLGFTVAVLLNDAWLNQIEIAIGLSIGMLILPLFFLILLNQLNNSNRLLQQKMEETEYLATHDTLTGLPNKILLENHLSQAIENAKKYNYEIALFFIDINSFKHVNDTLGHDIGDQYIKQFSLKVGYCLRSTDILARLSADSFMIVLESKQPDSYAAQIANRMIDQVSGRYNLSGYEVYGTFSAGIAVYPHDGDSVKELIKNADTALHYAKKRCKPAYQFYDTAMSKEVEHTLNLHFELIGAIENKEFEVHYQPIVDSHTQCVTGAEALLRWNHPIRGIICPNEFIDVAEKNGLMNEIGSWIIETVCADRARWNTFGLVDIVTTINVSGHQFMDEDFTPHLNSVLKQYQIKPSQIALEITERILVEEYELVKNVFDQLALADIKLSLDDFGTGYSSLRYLKRFPISTIKIDQSFIKDIETNKDDASLVQTIIAIGENLNMNVIAEGVENYEQYILLRSWGCESIQGHYFGKPIQQMSFLAQLLNKKKIGYGDTTLDNVDYV